jgi:hypothetical protein
MEDFSESPDEALTDALCSHVITSTIRGLRDLGVSDGDIAAALYAGLRTMMRKVPNPETFAALMVDIASEVVVHG